MVGSLASFFLPLSQWMMVYTYLSCVCQSVLLYQINRLCSCLSDNYQNYYHGVNNFDLWNPWILVPFLLSKIFSFLYKRGEGWFLNFESFIRQILYSPYFLRDKFLWLPKHQIKNLFFREHPYKQSVFNLFLMEIQECQKAKELPFIVDLVKILFIYLSPSSHKVKRVITIHGRSNKRHAKIFYIVV